MQDTKLVFLLIKPGDIPDEEAHTVVENSESNVRMLTFLGSHAIPRAPPLVLTPAEAEIVAYCPTFEDDTAVNMGEDSTVVIACEAL